MIYAAYKITGPVAYGSVCIYILCLCLPFIFYLMKSVRKLVTWQKLAFSELRKCKFPDFWDWCCVYGAPLPCGCTTLSQGLSKYWSFLVTPPESEESLQPCCWQPISCRSHCTLWGGQEIPVTDRNAISLCCPVAAGFSGPRPAFFPLNRNSHVHGMSCISAGMRQAVLPMCTCCSWTGLVHVPGVHLLFACSWWEMLFLLLGCCCEVRLL